MNDEFFQKGPQKELDACKRATPDAGKRATVGRNDIQQPHELANVLEVPRWERGARCRAAHTDALAVWNEATGVVAGELGRGTLVYDSEA